MAFALPASAACVLFFIKVIISETIMHKFTEKEILKMLKKFFGFTQFKGRQLEIIKALLAGKD